MTRLKNSLIESFKMKPQHIRLKGKVWNSVSEGDLWNTLLEPAMSGQYRSICDEIDYVVWESIGHEISLAMIDFAHSKMFLDKLIDNENTKI